MRTIQRTLWVTGLLWSFLWLGLSAQSVAPKPTPTDPVIVAQHAAAKAAKSQGQPTNLALEVTPASPVNTAAAKSTTTGPSAVSASPVGPKQEKIDPADRANAAPISEAEKQRHRSPERLAELKLTEEPKADTDKTSDQ